MSDYEISGSVVYAIGNSIVLDTQGTGTVYDSSVMGSQLRRADIGNSMIHGSNVLSSTIRFSQLSQCGVSSSTVNGAFSSGSQISQCTIRGRGGNVVTSDCQLNRVSIMCGGDSTLYLSEAFDSSIHLRNSTIMRSFISGVSITLDGAIVDGAHITSEGHFDTFDHNGHPVVIYRSVRSHPSMMVNYKGVTCQIDSITCSAIGYGKVKSLMGVNDLGEHVTMSVSPQVVHQWATEHPDMFKH